MPPDPLTKLIPCYWCDAVVEVTPEYALTLGWKPVGAPDVWCCPKCLARLDKEDAANA